MEKERMIEKWKGYLTEFENNILIPMYENGNFKIKSEPVPLRVGKLHKTPFAGFIGKGFEYGSILSFNYYGLFKLSSGLIKIKPVPGMHIITAPVIHFSSIKVEHIEFYQKELLLDFVSFKKFLVSLRWSK